LVDTIEQPIIASFFGVATLTIIKQIELIAGGFFTVFGGFMMDFIGRKRTIIIAFAILGAGYAVLSLSTFVPFSWLFFAIADGVAWGILTTAFMLTLWGDISKTGSSESYFALGSTTISIGGVVRMILAPYLGLIPIYGAFSLASLLLFVATIPLLLAPETLPEEVLEKRRIIKYAEKAKRIAERMRD
jgi:MFS family permease